MSQKMLLWISFVLSLSLPDSIGFDNLALNRAAYQSSTYPIEGNSTASKAVDGVISQNWPNLALTDFENTVWWYVDLEAPRNIHNINIYYRAENDPDLYRRRFAGFSLYISDTGYTSRGGYNCPVNSTYPPLLYSVNCMYAGRYVSLYNQIPSSDPSAKGAIIELGEVQVFGCSSATMYGANCNIPCSDKCKNRLCNITSGNCFSCIDGYQGIACDQPCSAGKYGEGCNHNCSINCVDPISCNHVDGACVGGCNPGWKGSRCDQKCPNGTYGSGCDSLCSYNCKIGTLCHHVTGTCDYGCKDGYYDLRCMEACSGNCKANAVCDRLTGICSGGCAAGWETETCSKVSQKSSVSLDLQLGVGIAIGIGISAVLAITAILGRLAFRRRRNAPNKPENTKQPDVTYSNDVMRADQLKNSANNDDYQELSEIEDANPQYDAISPNAK